MAAGALLLRGQLRTRLRRQAALAASLAAGLAGFLLVAMLLQGTQDGVVRPLRDTLAGDVRVTWGSDDIAGGLRIADHRGAAESLRSIPGAVVSPRWEASQVTVRSGMAENWTGGLLVGVDPSIAEERAALAPYVTWGRGLEAGSVADPATGMAYMPLVVGEPAARRLNLTLGPDGQPDFGAIVDVTSGRFAQGNDPWPLSLKGIVVGTFATGVDSLDRYTVFAPIEDVRRLVGDRPGDPSANAIVVWHASQAQVERLDLPGANVEDAAGFTAKVMGSVLLLLRLAAGLAIALVLTVFGVWLVHETATLVSRDRQAVAALRAVGIPFGAILRSYGGVVAATVGAALAVALAAVVLVAWLMPPVRVDTQSLHLSVPWSLTLEPILWAVAATCGLAALSTWVAARRLAAVDVAEALRP